MYFKITAKSDGNADIFTLNGKELGQNTTYEMNPKQPKYIKIWHEKTWCTLFDYRGHAVKGTIYANNVHLNDDGSYDVQEYCHQKQWIHYDNGANNRRIWDKAKQVMQHFIQAPKCKQISWLFLFGFVSLLQAGDVSVRPYKQVTTHSISNEQNIKMQKTQRQFQKTIAE